MHRASQIVDALLEADPAGVDQRDTDVGHYVDQLKQDVTDGKVTASSTASHFYHRTLKHKDGKRPIEVRRNGKTQTWKRQPGKFRIPCKYGMYEYVDITDQNASEWSSVPPRI